MTTMSNLSWQCWSDDWCPTRVGRTVWHRTSVQVQRTARERARLRREHLDLYVQMYTTSAAASHTGTSVRARFLPYDVDRDQSYETPSLVYRPVVERHVAAHPETLERYRADGTATAVTLEPCATPQCTDPHCLCHRPGRRYHHVPHRSRTFPFAQRFLPRNDGTWPPRTVRALSTMAPGQWHAGIRSVFNLAVATWGARDVAALAAVHTSANRDAFWAWRSNLDQVQAAHDAALRDVRARRARDGPPPKRPRTFSRYRSRKHKRPRPVGGSPVPMDVAAAKRPCCMAPQGPFQSMVNRVATIFGAPSH